MATANSISKFENSLREFLINVMSDKYGDAKSYAYRYNNLKVFMDPKRCSDPHFFVSIGISEANFSILDGKKLDGGLGAEDGYVKRWSDRVNINNELRAHWKIIKEAIAAEQEEDTGKKSSVTLRLRRAENSQDNLDVDMTGTGIDKTKREAKTKRLLKMKNNVLDSNKKDDKDKPKE
ncbi:unknown [Clostridium sp. CAG:813]|nr:unknown [Clostridium sp. CAG:813]